jgi:hypothetical protein
MMQSLTNIDSSCPVCPSLRRTLRQIITIAASMNSSFNLGKNDSGLGSPSPSNQGIGTPIKHGASLSPSRSNLPPRGYNTLNIPPPDLQDSESRHHTHTPSRIKNPNARPKLRFWTAFGIALMFWILAAFIIRAVVEVLPDPGRHGSVWVRRILFELV